MKVVIAIDSFKGSMSSMEAGYAAKRGILRACDAQITVKPLADGGEGTTGLWERRRMRGTGFWETAGRQSWRWQKPPESFW